jgi:peptide/nickel transport system substrate-binding protein
MDPRRKPLRPLALVVAGVMAFAACGGDNSKENVSQAAGPTKDTVRIALSSFGNEQLDPLASGGQNFANVLLPMYDSVLELGEDGTRKAGLAEKWETSEDGLTWTFHLRKGVQFHDGWGEATARDVVFSIKRWMDPAGQAADGVTLAQKIESIEASDDYTVVVHTKGVQVDLAYYFGPHQVTTGIVFSEKYLTEKGGPDFASQNKLMNERPIGSGPFRFVSQTKGQKIVFQRVENHWRAKPAMKTIEFLLVPEPTTQVAMLKSGEADIIELGADNAKEIENAGYEVRSVKDAFAIGVAFPGTRRPPAANKPTTKVEVREALSYAIDRKTILETVFAGRGTLSDTPYDTVASTKNIDENHYKDIAQKWNTYDPTKAKQILAAAGYPNGFDGIKMFTFTLPGLGFLPQLGEIIASQWKEIGVTTAIVATDYGNYRPHWVQPKPNDPYNAGDVNPIGQIMRFETVDLLRTYYWSKGVIPLVDDQRLDALLDQASAERDDAKREVLVSQAFDIAHANWTMLPLFRLDALYGVNSKEVGQWTMGRLLETIR